VSRGTLSKVIGKRFKYTNISGYSAETFPLLGRTFPRKMSRQAHTYREKRLGKSREKIVKVRLCRILGKKNQIIWTKTSDELVKTNFHASERNNLWKKFP